MFSMNVNQSLQLHYLEVFLLYIMWCGSLHNAPLITSSGLIMEGSVVGVFLEQASHKLLIVSTV